MQYAIQAGRLIPLRTAVSAPVPNPPDSRPPISQAAGQDAATSAVQNWQSQRLQSHAEPGSTGQPRATTLLPANRAGGPFQLHSYPMRVRPTL